MSHRQNLSSTSGEIPASDVHVSVEEDKEEDMYGQLE
jgi:hypothetical protein